MWDAGAGGWADGQHLDFLELVDDEGVIVSSAQWAGEVWI